MERQSPRVGGETVRERSFQAYVYFGRSEAIEYDGHATEGVLV
jgi:hypothetical protein